MGSSICGIDVRDLSKTFDAGSSERTVALDRVSFQVRPGDFITVVGPNGSGKTTLLNVLAGRCAPDSGTVSVFAASEEGSREFMPMLSGEPAERIAYVNQDARQGTFLDLTVLENLRIAALRGRPSLFKRALPASFGSHASDRLAKHNLADRANAVVSELSQGQRQLVAMEIALMRDPYLLLLDEHTASLDQKNARICMAATEQLSLTMGLTILMATHNLGDAIYFGNRMLILRNGKIAADLSGSEKSNTATQQLLEITGMLSAEPLN